MRRRGVGVSTGTSAATQPLTPAALEIDAEQEVAEIVAKLRHTVGRVLQRRGAVVGLSGGVDSSVTCALCARALGAERTLALLMPERDSDPGTPALSERVASALGLETTTEDITPLLEAAGCYARRDAAVRDALPEFDGSWRWKIVLPAVVGNDLYRVFFLVAERPNGETLRVRLPAAAYLAIVAATNFKQRVRKMLEYFHADRLGFAVVGTPNRLEFDQGFFVKGGDGLADIKPIAGLYKSQVYALARELRIPAEVCEREPTTDTYSLPQTQEEFYFSLPYEQMDLCLYAYNHGMPADSVAEAVGLAPEDVSRVFRDIEGKRRATRYLHLPPLLLKPVEEVARSLRGAGD